MTRRTQARAAQAATPSRSRRTPRRALPASAATAAPATNDAGCIQLFKDAGLTPVEAAELLHILSACVVGFGFAALWGRQMAAAREAARAGDELGPAPAHDEAGDLADYLEATRRWDPAQFTAAVDIVLGAYGDDAEG